MGKVFQVIEQKCICCQKISPEHCLKCNKCKDCCNCNPDDNFFLTWDKIIKKIKL